MKQLWKRVSAIGAISGLIGMSLMQSFAAGNDGAVLESLKSEFSNPDSSYKPLTRWWVPGDLMTEEEIRKELKSMADAGFGGAEIVPVSVEGGDGEGSIGWGTERWKQLTKTMLEVAAEYDMTIDFTMTPAWPLALPTITEVDSEEGGAQRELDGAFIDGITRENPFDGKLPISEEAEEDASKVDGTAILEALTIAKYVDKEEKILDFSSAIKVDVTEAEDGNFSFTPEDDGEYVLFAWYAHPSGNTKYENNQVDHYSLAGTQAIIQYWEEELIPYYGDAFSSVRSLFIDSLEFETHLDWTFGILDQFIEKKGYDITPYLPALYDNDAIGNYMGDPEADFSFQENTLQIQNEFKQFLTELYIENHIKPLEAFCASHGVTLRYQTSYGKNLQLTETALFPDVPETESLYGGDFLDFYRLQSGAVHIGNKEIYSLETAAEWTETWNPPKENGLYGTRGNGENNSGNYQQTFKDHLWHDQRAYSVGVNQVVFHGYPYNGQYDGEGNEDGFLAGLEWGGFTGFPIDRWSNSWGERQPNWELTPVYTQYLTRLQYILRKGTAKVDLAIYDQSYYELIDFWGNEKVYDSTDLEQHGYSYDFVAPLLLEQDGMTVEDGVLNADGPSYKALVLNNQKEIPYATLSKILSYAEEGLPIVIIGDVVDASAYYEGEEIATLADELLSKESVIRVSAMDEVVPALTNAEILPDASYNAGIIANHRQDGEDHYYYLYHYGDAANYQEAQELETIQTSITLQGEGNPYLLNAWNGEITPVAEFTRNDASSITMDITLPGNDSLVVALLTEEELLQGYASDDFSIEYVENDLLLKGIGSGSYFVEGKEESITLEDAEDVITLSGWNLSVESWTKGETPVDIEKTEISLGELDSLKSWIEIEGLEDVSGIGYYTTSFTLEKGWEDGQGAVLSIGNIKDAFEIKINGQVVEESQMAKEIDVGEYLVSGENTIEIKVATALLNAMLKEHPEDLRSRDSYGLVEELVLTPYSYVKLSGNESVTEPTESIETTEEVETETSASETVESSSDSSGLPTGVLVLVVLVVGCVVYFVRKKK